MLVVIIAEKQILSPKSIGGVPVTKKTRKENFVVV